MTTICELLPHVVAAVAVVGGFVTWCLNRYRHTVLARLQLPDGSPTVDEYVTRSMLALSQTCAKLCRRIYCRLEDLVDVMPAQLEGIIGCRVLTAPDQSAVCCIVHYADAAIIVWRGTNLLNRAQVKANRRAELQQLDSRIPGKVHAGLKQMLGGIIELELLGEIAAHVEAGRKIYVTGHSQGAGLAALTVALLRCQSSHRRDRRWLPSGLITFGSLRPGDARFADYVANACDYKPHLGRFGIQRYRNNNDIVTLVPLITQGYRHCGQCLYIWPRGMVTRSPGRFLRLLQQLKAITDGVISDGLQDHSMNRYEHHLLALRIPATHTTQDKARTA